MPCAFCTGPIGCCGTRHHNLLAFCRSHPKYFFLSFPKKAEAGLSTSSSKNMVRINQYRSRTRVCLSRSVRE